MSTRIIFRAALVALSFGCSLATTSAQAEGQAGVPVVWSLPDSPAASALDIGRGEANPPSIMAPFSYEILNTDEATGAAGEFSPLLAYRSFMYADDEPQRLLTIDEYQSDFATRLAARVSVSGAAVRAEKGANRAALAARWTVFNRGDPYGDHRADAYRDVNLYSAPTDRDPASGCLVEAVNNLPPPVHDSVPVRPEGTEGNIWQTPNAELAKEFAECVDKFQSATWNATSLQLMAVQTYASGEEDGFDGLETAGARVAGVLSYGFEGIGSSRRILRHNSQILLSVAYGAGVQAESEAGDSVERDETTVGIRLRFAPPVRPPNAEDLPSDARGRRANGNNFNIYTEAAWSQHDYDSLPDQEQWTYTFGAEYQLPWAENVWLGVSSQSSSGDDITGDESRTGLQLRWALTTTPAWGR